MPPWPRLSAAACEEPESIQTSSVSRPQVSSPAAGQPVGPLDLDRQLRRQFRLLGDKGRFVLPPKFRKTLKDSNPGGEKKLYLDMHPYFPCLVGFGEPYKDVLRAEVPADAADAETRALRAFQFYSFDAAPFDDSGRFILPERYFKLGNLTDAAFFQGGGKSFTIWNPEELARMGAGWEDAQEACLDLASQARSGKGRK